MLIIKIIHGLSRTKNSVSVQLALYAVTLSNLSMQPYGLYNVSKTSEQTLRFDSFTNKSYSSFKTADAPQVIC